MFLFLLFATFVVALLVSFVVMCLFAKPIDSVLRRIIADEISAAWSKYLKFAILVVGVSAGVQLRDLEKYITPMLGGREVQSVSLGFDRWVFEIYRTAIETLEVDALPALGADHTRAFEAGEIFRRNFHLDPLLVEKNVIGKLRVGFLLAGLPFESGEHFAGRLFRRFLRGDADRAAVF